MPVFICPYDPRIFLVVLKLPEWIQQIHVAKSYDDKYTKLKTTWVQYSTDIIFMESVLK